jgi:hypothetical protein
VDLGSDSDSDSPRTERERPASPVEPAAHGLSREPSGRFMPPRVSSSRPARATTRQPSGPSRVSSWDMVRCCSVSALKCQHIHYHKTKFQLEVGMDGMTREAASDETKPPHSILSTAPQGRTSTRLFRSVFANNSIPVSHGPVPRSAPPSPALPWLDLAFAPVVAGVC